MNPQTINESIDKLITEHNLATEALTREQLAKVIREMIQSGDLMRYVHVAGSSQAIVYVPFRELDRVSEQLHAVTAERNELRERLERHIAVNQEGSERVETLRVALKFYADGKHLCKTERCEVARDSLRADMEAVRIGTPVPSSPPISSDATWKELHDRLEAVTNERDALKGFIKHLDELERVKKERDELKESLLVNPHLHGDAVLINELNLARAALERVEHERDGMKLAEARTARQRDDVIALCEGWKQKTEKWKECAEHLSTQLADELAVFRIGNERRTGSEIRALAERDKAVLELDKASREATAYKLQYETLLSSLEQIILKT